MPVVTNGTADSPMMPIIMITLGFMQEDKHNHYLSDRELDTVLPSSGYSIITPPPGYIPIVAPQKLMATPATKVGGFQIQRGLDDAATAAGLAPKLPMEIPGVGNLAFFKVEDAQYFAKAQDLERGR